MSKSLSGTIAVAVLQWLRVEPPGHPPMQQILLGWGTHAPPGMDEPAPWILEALHAEGDPALVDRMAARLAAWLDTEPDRLPPTLLRDQRLYSALVLAAGLERPELLFLPLHRVYTRQALDGHWRGVPLRRRLREALIVNQVDATMLDVWQQMRRDHGHPFLGGDAEIGRMAWERAVAAVQERLRPEDTRVLRDDVRRMHPADAADEAVDGAFRWFSWYVAFARIQGTPERHVLPEAYKFAAQDRNVPEALRSLSLSLDAMRAVATRLRAEHRPLRGGVSQRRLVGPPEVF
ncbi:MAG: hypothetical protein Q8P41_23325 [Pseudomonadota bacterium]|nr:hypothetical protein [Pseudomonadota bacterium]